MNSVKTVAAITPNDDKPLKTYRVSCVRESQFDMLYEVEASSVEEAEQLVLYGDCDNVVVSEGWTNDEYEDIQVYEEVAGNM